jgi:hypothetical protein
MYLGRPRRTGLKAKFPVSSIRLPDAHLTRGVRLPMAVVLPKIRRLCPFPADPNISSPAGIYKKIDCFVLVVEKSAEIKENPL